MREARRREAWKPEESEQRYAEAQIRRADVQNRQSLRDFAEWLSSARGLARSTITLRIGSACTFVKAVSPRLADSCASAFRALTVEGVEDFFIEYVQGHSPSVRRSMQTAMRLFLRFAADKGWVDEDVAGSVPSLRSWRLSGLPRGLSDGQLSHLLAAPFEHGECPCRDWAIVCVLVTYGVRRSQVSALRFKDLDWQERSIEFAAHKRGKAVRHRLTNAVAEALAAYLRSERAESDQNWVFLRHRRPYERLSPTAITTLVRARAKRRGLDPISPHALRHSFAGRLLRSGQPMKTIADLLGHRSLMNVGIYAKVDFTRLSEVAEEWPEVGS